MPGFLMHALATIQCPHAIPAQLIPTQARVLVSGMPVALMPNQIVATGCPFTVPPGKPQPCVLAKWLMPASRVLVNNTPVMIATPKTDTNPTAAETLSGIPSTKRAPMPPTKENGTFTITRPASTADSNAMNKSANMSAMVRGTMKASRRLARDKFSN